MGSSCQLPVVYIWSKYLLCHRVCSVKPTLHHTSCGCLTNFLCPCWPWHFTAPFVDYRHTTTLSNSSTPNIIIRAGLVLNHLNNHCIHLCFKQAQPKMSHSPKVDDGVDIFFLKFLNTYFWTIFFSTLN